MTGKLRFEPSGSKPISFQMAEGMSADLSFQGIQKRSYPFE